MWLLRHDAWTRAWVIPVGNLLGIVLVCLAICPTAALGASMPESGNPSAPIRAASLLTPATLMVAGMIAWRWRLRQPGVHRIVRWFSPYEGATIVIFPIWVCSAVLLTASVLGLVRHLH